MKHIFADLDNTITESRQKISPEMKDVLIAQKCPLYVISGASRQQMEFQLDNLPCTILAQSGNDTPLWQDTLTPEEVEEVYSHLDKISAAFPEYIDNYFEHFWQADDLVENRGCQISLSFVGHHGDAVVKYNFDQDKKKRQAILDKVPFESETLRCTIAGTTCLDYTRKEGTKGKNIERWIKENNLNKEDCVYYGDALFKGGNDESVLGVIKTVEVKNPPHLAELLKQNLPVTVEQFTRVVNNFYIKNNIPADQARIQTDLNLHNYLIANLNKPGPQYKVAFVFICLNPLYWEFAPEMVRTAKKFLLPGHKTDFLFWTDIPEKDDEIEERMVDSFRGAIQNFGGNAQDFNLIYHPVTIKGKQMNIPELIKSVKNLRKTEGVTIFPTEPIPWPYPTLKRFHLFLQQEEKLKEYDYIFYCDVDMQFVNIVGDEILGNGLTAAPHPGYYLNPKMYPPYEPNPFSASYIPRPGRVVDDPNSTSEKKARFRPEYYAGGFQGGKSALFIEAMKACRELIDRDLKMGYIPIWNDETAWNKYLSENPPSVMLDPSYIYPDSLIEEYYVKLWGRNFTPKIVTLTKWFSLNAQLNESFYNLPK